MNGNAARGAGKRLAEPHRTPAPAAGPERATILLVDDEAEILTALTDLLEDGFDVVSTTRPEEALRMLAGGLSPAVILSDQRMPGLTGDAFLERARAYSDAEALLLTGYAELDAVVGAVNRGRIAGYASKPWEPAALLAMVTAARDRHGLRRALETERALLRGLLDNLPDELSFKDAEGRFLRLNAAKAATLGAPLQACLGRREAEFLDAAAAARLARAERAALVEGAVSELEERHGPEGMPHWMQVSRVSLGGGVLVTIARDVTEARQMESRLRQADKMQALGTMAGGVAHDFNNLLTAILGSLQLAERRVGEEEAGLRRLLRNATMAAERGSALTRRLLAFSRQNELALRAVSVNRLILGMGDLLARTLGGTVVVRRELAAHPGTAMVDPGQLELALLNLCINARDAMPGGGTITLSTANAALGPEEVPELAAGSYVRVSVADTGTGMPPEVLARVFEPFFTTKEVGKGTGLGLSMVYGLVRQSGGGMTIDSAPGEGTRVTLYLPAGEAEVAREGGEAQDAPMAQDPVRVLVVDDDATVREVTAGFLSELGHETVEAEDGQSALHVLENDPSVRLMVADFAMPRMTGAELSERARAMRPDLPILLVTGYAELAALAANIPVLHKPYRQAELAEQVAALLG
ncbi:PAS domain S-box-containing protein [Roseomonas rosea]|uniref:histidine kinase n=1 Tax=Muricoccus roseus TaxID=198092 RepID=A0A1M6MA30_9PROT|nr:response regulator [Roseomonas rosea]SHJ80274.1 PAS domain S-box-containing protein [Roseomonas rosea]